MTCASAPAILLSKFKNTVAARLRDHRSASVTEAIAAGCGYRTHAAFLHDIRAGAPFSLVPVSRVDAVAMGLRLADLTPERAHGVMAEVARALEAASRRLASDIVPIGANSTLHAGAGPLLATATGLEPPNPLDRLLRRAVDAGADSLWIEPDQTGYTAFAGIDGVRERFHQGDHAEADRLFLDAKARAGIAADEWHPADSRFRFAVDGHALDIGTRFVRTAIEEVLVLRWRDSRKALSRLDDLGITGVAAWKAAIVAGSGLFLVGGPTRSGVTTTVEASIRHLGGDAALATARCDTPSGILPRIVDMGELRDSAGLFAAIAAAESGRTVFATMHVGSSHYVYQRLRDLGASPDTVAGALKGIVVQTLARVDCRACAGTGAADGQACAGCDGRGVSGRTALSEVVVPRKEDIAAGMKPFPSATPRVPYMLEDGFAKMRDGIVSFEELRRLFGHSAEAMARKRGMPPGPATPAL